MTIAETANAINNLIRTVIGGLFVAAIGYGGGWLYSNFNPDVRLQQKEHELQQVQEALGTAHQQLTQQNVYIQKLGVDLNASQQRVAQLDTSLKLLKVQQRVAEIRVLRQGNDPASQQLVTEFTFQEIDRQGAAIDLPKKFRVVGDLVYLDYLVVKFNDEFVEQGDPERSGSICLFNRLFGEFQEPYEGFLLDERGRRPRVYGRDGQISAFEQQIWSNFWDIANDPRQAADLGIRAAHGEAVATRLRPGKTYRIRLRASGGLSIRPIADANPKPDAVSLQSPGSP